MYSSIKKYILCGIFVWDCLGFFLVYIEFIRYIWGLWRGILLN